MRDLFAIDDGSHQALPVVTPVNTYLADHHFAAIADRLEPPLVSKIISNCTHVEQYHTRIPNQFRESLNIHVLKVLLSAGSCQP